MFIQNSKPMRQMRRLRNSSFLYSRKVEGPPVEHVFDWSFIGKHTYSIKMSCYTYYTTDTWDLMKQINSARNFAQVSCYSQRISIMEPIFYTKINIWSLFYRHRQVVLVYVLLFTGTPSSEIKIKAEKILHIWNFRWKYPI